jgi:hypothetical protein
VRELESHLEEARDELDREKQLRTKAERQRKELSAEMENLKSEFMDANDKTVVSREIQLKNEEHIKGLQV